jgi:hypothetical protein
MIYLSESKESKELTERKDHKELELTERKDHKELTERKDHKELTERKDHKEQHKEIDENDPETFINSKKEFQTLFKACRLNYMLSQLKLNEFSSVITQAEIILKEDPKNIKARFRRAQAYVRRKRDFDLAEKDLNVLLEYADDAVKIEIKPLLKEIQSLKDHHENVERQIYTKMFQ